MVNDKDSKKETPESMSLEDLKNYAAYIQDLLVQRRSEAHNSEDSDIISK